MRAPLILISAPRSGTNFVLDVIGACEENPAILGEILRPGSDTRADLAALTGRSPDELVEINDRSQVELWDLTRTAAAAQDRMMAAKIFYSHANRRAPIWRHLKRTARPLHLIRRNLLANFVSLKLAKATGIWQQRRPGQPFQPQPLVVSPAEFDSFAANRRSRIAWVRQTFAGPLYREAYYEDLDESAGHCAAALFALGVVPRVPEGPPAVRFHRQGRGSLAERIANYDEVRHLDREEDLSAPPPPKAREAAE